MLTRIHDSSHHTKRRWFIALSVLASIAVVGLWAQYLDATLERAVAVGEAPEEGLGVGDSVRGMGASIYDALVPGK